MTTGDKITRTGRKDKRNRLLSAAIVFVFIVAQLMIAVPAVQEYSYAAGGSLEVRVKYFGDQGDKIRTKWVFSESELYGLGSAEHLYSNVTSIGTVLSIRAEGPQILSIIDAAGIDINSVARINFRSGDDYGYTMDFSVANHLSGGRYYYPNLNRYYTKNDDNTLTPMDVELADGTIINPLDDGYEVPAILALRYGSSKARDITADSLSLGTEDIYRFCMGQKPLQKNVKTRSDEATSMESIKKIHGIDVTLYGSPVSGIMMDLTSGQMKVGSKKKANAVFSGDELFADVLGSFAGKLTWKSSNPSVVKVDQNGNITVLKKGRATITVSANGLPPASITIEAVDDPKKTNAGSDKAAAGKKPAKSKSQNKARDGNNSNNNTKSKATSATKASSANSTAAATEKAAVRNMVTVREISIGDIVQQEASIQDQMRENMSDDAQALGKIQEFGRGAAAGTAGAALLVGGAGAVLRIRRFRRDIL